MTGNLKAIIRMTSFCWTLQAQHCLTTGAVQHRINRLLRMTPEGEVADCGGNIGAYEKGAPAAQSAGFPPVPPRPTKRARGPFNPLFRSNPPQREKTRCSTYQRGWSGASAFRCLRGGLGYRPWKSHADCAFLASYMNTAHHFPKLLPALAHCVPPILDLVPATGTPPPPPSPQAALAARAGRAREAKGGGSHGPRARQRKHKRPHKPTTSAS